MILEFKSNYENFRKESLGNKNNTVRKLKFDKNDIVRIIFNEKPDTIFERQISDITIFDGRLIVSWYDDELPQKNIEVRR